MKILKNKKFCSVIIVYFTLLLIVNVFQLSTATKPLPTTQQQIAIPNIFNTFLNDQTNNSVNVDNSYDDDIYVPFRSDNHDQFSWLLLKHELQNNYNNIVISPFLIKLVLALLSEASGNDTETQKELLQTLTDIRTPTNLRSYYKKVLKSLKKPNPNYALDLEAKIFVQKPIEPQQRFAAVVQSHYYTNIEILNFEDPITSVMNINAWCNKITNGKLSHIVDIETIKNNVMLIINVIYYNGLWKQKFNSSHTGVFFRSKNEQVKADYMENTGYYYYNESPELGLEMLRLPYQGNAFSMFILLPNPKTHINDVIKIMKNEELKQMQWMMERAKVKVTLPKFKYNYKKNFKDSLIALNVKSIFSNNASLPGLARGNLTVPLKVSNVLQTAGIEVNEIGTEAYASTVVEIENKFGGDDEILEFNVNRSFIFFIEEETSGNILFTGKVTDPLWES